VELFVIWNFYQVELIVLPTFSEDSEPHHMGLESLFACDDDGRGNGVSSNNPLASMFPGANKI
jgi:hypothetical protein